MTDNTSKFVTTKSTVSHTPSSPKANFSELEQIIQTNLAGSFKLAAALATIRAQELYKPDYKTFEEYCQKRWGYSRSYGIRLCDMNNVMNDLEPYQKKEVYPHNEAQARVFVDLNKTERLELAETIMKKSKEDILTASVYTKFKKKLFPDKFAGKPAKNKAIVIDVEVVNEAKKTGLVKAWEAAKALYEELMAGECEGETVDLLKAFIDSAKMVIPENAEVADK
jgi:hypothetical protein